MSTNPRPAAKLKEDGIHIGEIHLPAHLVTPDVNIVAGRGGVQLLSIELLVSSIEIESGVYRTFISGIGDKDS